MQEARTENPIVLVQDYHFALLPRMIRERLPQATIITFWHIPWPNPEAFGICPWRDELLEGLLGCSILGFHTQFHCNNFVDTVDRDAGSARRPRNVHHLLSAASRPRCGAIRSRSSGRRRRSPRSRRCRSAARRCARRSACGADVRLGVGVDRLDYTKGILERFAAVERLLELEPHWIGRFAFVQIAAPSRSSIEEYQSLEARVRAAATRINERFGIAGLPADRAQDRAP